MKASPNCKRFSSGDTTGKWCVLVPPAEVDAAWDQIKGALQQNQLLCAKVSTALRSMGRDTHVICVYTEDWTDTQELMRTRDVLRSLGFTEELGYKRDIDTKSGVYGPDEWYLRV
nr:putative phosphothreonine lyase domain-containg protein [Burkholderia pseudomallei]